ncbi:MAG TPA: ferritin-like domain-containing protein [Candidatus Binatia bacterium]
MKTQATEHETLLNRTGIMTNPELSAELIQGAKEAEPSSDGDVDDIAAKRAEYLEQALPIGSKPLPVADDEITGIDEEGEGAVEAAQSLPVLLDKLGERLAFERQGTRLYEALIQKCELIGEIDGGPSVADLRHIHEEEMEHFKMLQRVITETGGDATVQTPSADIIGVLSHGILQVVSDPRTTLAQSLQGMLNAELADNDGWQMLITLATSLGRDDLEDDFEKALDSEQEHLENVRAWLETLTLGEAQMMGVVEESIVEYEAVERVSPSGSGKKKPASSKKKKKK